MFFFVSNHISLISEVSSGREFQMFSPIRVTLHKCFFANKKPAIFRWFGDLPIGQHLACKNNGQAKACVNKGHDQRADQWVNPQTSSL
jgi:hypothetical protein